MTGRLLLSRPGYPLDMHSVIDACAEHGVVIELNANPSRLDIDWRYISYALSKTYSSPSIPMPTIPMDMTTIVGYLLPKRRW